MSRDLFAHRGVDWGDALILEAFREAARAHTEAGQRRKYSDDPYIVHPIAVADMVARSGGDRFMVAAALLHDVVEDTPITIEYLRPLFPDDVIGLVWDLTDQFPAGHPVGNREARKRAEAERTGKIPLRAKIIKLCDLIHNTSSIVEKDPGFAKVYLAEKKRILECMKDNVDSDPLVVRDGLWYTFERLWDESYRMVDMPG